MQTGKLDALSDALSCRTDYELAHVKTFSSSISDLTRATYIRGYCIAFLCTLGSEVFKDKSFAVRFYGLSCGFLPR